MTISKKDLQLLIGFAGVLLVVLTYFFIFTKIQDKTDLIKADNETLSVEVGKLETLNANKEQYLADTQNFDKEIAELLVKYDISYLPEDDIMFIANMEDSETNQIVVTYLNLSDTVAMEAQVAATEADDLGMIPAVNNIAMFQVPFEFGFNVTYDGFKNMVNYIYSTGGRKNIDSINLLFDATTGQLTGSIVSNRYVITGTDQVAETTEIPSMEIGVEDIFKTTDGE